MIDRERHHSSTTMQPRFQLGLALVALFGIVTTNSLMEIDLTNLTEEQKTGPVPVKRHDKVYLRCGKFGSPIRWVRIDDSKLMFRTPKTKSYEIQNFTMHDNGNYQCREEMHEYRRCSNVVLCEAADDFSKCKIEGQTYWHLIKYGPFNQIRKTGKKLNEFRFDNLGATYGEPPEQTLSTVPMDEDVELPCGNMASERLEFFWLIAWKSAWFDLEGYAESSSNSVKLMPMHRGQYHYVFKSSTEKLVHRIFNVTFEDELLAPSYFEISSIRKPSGLLHDNINISCDIAINSARTIKWVKSNACPNTGTRVDERRILKTSDGSDARVLQINKLSSTDEGCYTCFASDKNITFFHCQRLRIERAVSDAELGAFSVELMVSIPCVVVLLLASIGAIICYSRRSKRDLRPRRVPSPQPRVVIDLKNFSRTILDLDHEEEVSLSMQICSKSDIGSVEKLDCETYQNFEYSPWDLAPDNIKLDDIMREHDFYTLYRARVVNLLPEGSIDVVVKMSKVGTTDSDVLAFVSEMETMKSVGRHVNVVGLLGTCTRTDALFFAMEFAEHGNLRDYLRERGSSFEYEYIDEWESKSERLSIYIDLVSYARQVAMGMEYLASRRCVHRDLRAKRVLTSKGGILKITDYAAQRMRRIDFHAVEQYNNLLSVRWMAPETLFNGIHDTNANVWSYGILLWEIMTFAETPYPLILTNDELLGRLKVGYYMENPNCCHEDMYKLMKRCWDKNSVRRPRFDQLVKDLDGMLEKLSDQLKRLESDNDQQAVYANTLSEALHKQYYDSEYADVGDAMDERLAPA